MATDQLETDEFTLTQPEVVKRLGISRTGLYRLDLPYRQFRARGRRYYRLADVEALLTSTIHQPKAEEFAK